MQKSGKSFIILVALTLLVGLWAYYAQKNMPPPQPQIASNSAPSTNQSYVHSNHPVVPESPASEDPNPNALSKIPRGKVEAYRNAASLLTAFHALQDTNYLNEVATNFPNDPRVQWTILARNAFPEDRRKWLDSFKASSPSNSIANYLSAQDYFKNNQPDAAMKELLTASAKSQFKDYSMDTILDSEALGRFSGSPQPATGATSLAAMSEDLAPELGNFKSIALGIKDMQQQYANSGDAASIQNLAQVGLGLADHLLSGDSGKFVFNQLVGLATEKIVLQSLDQNTSYDFLGGKTPTQQLDDLKQQRTNVADFLKNQGTLFPTLTEDQMNDYWERVKIYGELETMRWWQQQNPPQAQ